MSDPATQTLPTQNDANVSAPSVSVGPHLFLVLAGHRPLIEPGRHSLAGLDVVIIGRGERGVQRFTADGKRHLRLSVPDPWMSSSHVRLTNILGQWKVEDEQSRNGTFVNGLPVAAAALSEGDVLELGHTFFVYQAAVATLREDPDDEVALPRLSHIRGLTTLSPALAREFGVLAQMARSNVSIIIRGESGTGKELIARALHALSERPGSFVAINCGALPEALVESEFFGHRRGAFSGAVEDRPGLLRSADRGTLLLDEIGDLPAHAQVALLRALQERQVQPIGATRPISVDIRLCAATHRDLDRLAGEGVFRPDLLARISGSTLRLPPLRERRQDLGIIIGDLLHRLVGTRAEQISFTKEAVRAILGYPWPLNIRELEKCLERAVALATDNLIRPEYLFESSAGTTPRPFVPESAQGGGAWPTPPSTASPEPMDAKDRQRREELLALTIAHRGNVSSMARALGKERHQIRRWLRRYQIDPEDYRG
ncbi:MAG TPA: sigma 54-interacting transcriptional regulator [Polyangia bacterium]|nr:sigma 54-interacting transcriptional regulator [Polyangia bacterium]